MKTVLKAAATLAIFLQAAYANGQGTAGVKLHQVQSASGSTAHIMKPAASYIVRPSFDKVDMTGRATSCLQVDVNAKTGAFTGMVIKRITLTAPEEYRIAGKPAAYGSAADATSSSVILDIENGKPLSEEVQSVWIEVLPADVKGETLTIEFSLQGKDAGVTTELTGKVKVKDAMFAAGQVHGLAVTIPAKPGGKWKAKAYSWNRDYYTREILNILKKNNIASASVTWKDNLKDLSLSVVNEDYYEKAERSQEGASISTGSVYQAASISKVTFNHIFWKMREEGFFSDLDQPVYELWPGMLDLFAEDNRDMAEQITLRMILLHTSGLDRSMTKGPFKFKYVDKGIYPGGNTFSYSNAAISILGWTMEHLKGYEPGTGLTPISREYIFDPLGMQSTSFEWVKPYNKTAVYGYTSKGKRVRNNKWRGGLSNAAYSLRTNAVDYTKYLQWTMHGANLSDETMELMLKPQIGGTVAGRKGLRTLGWMCENDPRYGYIYRHNGSLAGFRGLACFIPSLDASFCVFVNTDTKYPVLDRICELFLPSNQAPEQTVKAAKNKKKK